jgi:hypothetical protein
MKTAVSNPARVSQSAESLADRLGISRSELYAGALAAVLEEHSGSPVTARLNEIYGPEGVRSATDRELARVQSRSLAEEKW